MKAKRLSKDITNILPSLLIENILCRVPIRDAVRTSILSRKWRYIWATIPKLVFNTNFMFDKSNEEQPEEPGNERKQLSRKLKILYAIHQVLLVHHGPLLEFNLFMKADKTCVEIDQIILYLSRNTNIKKLTLDLECVNLVLPPTLYKLPLSIFSLHQLTDLSLSDCEFEFNPTFNGFSCLTSLSLVYLKTSRETVLHLLSNCPLLKQFRPMLVNPADDKYVLTLDFNELLKCLPVIENLWISSWTIKCFAQQDLPTTFAHLKSLSMYRMQMVCKVQLLALFHLIRRSPNLEKIEIEQVKCCSDTSPVESIILLDDYSDIWLEHLHDLKIDDFAMSKLEMEFMKLILAKSPLLKKVRIVLDIFVGIDEELKISRILSRCPRASLVAQIIVERPPW